MSSLTLRIFLAFWLIIGVLVGMAGVTGYSYSERMREAIENFDMRDKLLAASDALEVGGRDGLVTWLESLPSDDPIAVIVVDASGTDLLGRELSRPTRRLIRRHSRGGPRWQRERGPRDGAGARYNPNGSGNVDNVSEARPLNRLRGPDGAVYTLVPELRRDVLQQWVGLRAGTVLLLSALLVSGLVSWALARAIARPVRSFRDATVAIAEGRLDTRVAEPMRNRRDEIGLLARDLDVMAARLEASAERQRELTRNVSHELRSPLARLRVALELARRAAGDLPEFSRIDVETERLDDMIGQLLRYSQADASALLHRETIDLSELLARIVDDANFECRSAGLEGVSATLAAPEELTIAADPALLSSMFENLLRNAIHHAPANTVVDVQVKTDSDSVEVGIIDRGKGVADTDLEHIFEPFFRAADAMASGRSGTGLGLAIAARAAAAHGGSIRAANLDNRFLIEVKLPISG